MKIATNRCRPYVQTQRGFQCHGSLYGRAEMAHDGTPMYVVYSYGPHWPLFVCHDGTWYENEDRRSVTTSKHRSMAHPLCDTIKVSGPDLKRFITHGTTYLPGIEPLLAVSAG